MIRGRAAGRIAQATASPQTATTGTANLYQGSGSIWFSPVGRRQRMVEYRNVRRRVPATDPRRLADRSSSFGRAGRRVANVVGRAGSAADAGGADSPLGAGAAGHLVRPDDQPA